MSTCLNISNKNVKAGLNELTAIFNHNIAYNLMSLNGGYPLDKAPNGKNSNIFDALVGSMKRREALKEKAKLYTPKFRNHFGDWLKPTVFTALNIDNIDELKEKFPSNLPNKFYHHSTVKFGSQEFNPNEGVTERVRILGRLTTDKVDVLLVENSYSDNKNPHITLATADKVKPFESNKEIEKNYDKIVWFKSKDTIKTTFRNNLKNEFTDKLDENGEPLIEKIPIKSIREANIKRKNIITYSDLGSTTEDEFVKISNKGRFPANNNEITAYRGPNTRNLKNELGLIKDFQEHNMIGNPFGPYGLTKLPADKFGTSTMAFVNWLLGNNYTNKYQKYRQVLLNNVDYIKGKKINYYFDLGRPSHATALSYLVNKTSLLEKTNPTKETQTKPIRETLFDAKNKELKKGAVVTYKGNKYLLWNVNSSNKAQLIKVDGTKFTGTPDVDKLTVLGTYPTVSYNNTDYIVTDKGNVYSGATGKLVYTSKDNSTKTQKKNIIDKAKEELGITNPSEIKYNSKGEFSKENDNIYYQNNTNQSDEDYVASEKTIRDLAERMAYRIGLKVKYISDRTSKWKGKLEGNTAVINLAYATLDTTIHEILGHPIIRAIKNEFKGSHYKVGTKAIFHGYGEPYKVTVTKINNADSVEVVDAQGNKDTVSLYELSGATNSKLYQNLLKELEYGKGKEVLDRVKRDYITKEDGSKYTLEEQQEEALVELLGLYTADKLDNVKDGKLISLLKRLLKEMKAYIKSLFNQKEVKIDELPDNMTLGDLADLLAYRNSKLILPGNEIIYITPDDKTFKTYQEASNHISELAKLSEVDLGKIQLPKKISNSKDIPENIFRTTNRWYKEYYIVKDTTTGKWYTSSYEQLPSYDMENNLLNNEKVLELYRERVTYGEDNKQGVFYFISKNKEYAQSREIIEVWKKVNNIKYDPEEAYSRGNEFIHVHNAYGKVDTNVWLSNLLNNLDDLDKANSKMELSFITTPKGTLPNHITRSLNKKAIIKIKVFPKSEDIAFASKVDNFTSSYSIGTDSLNVFIKSSGVKHKEELSVSFVKSVPLKNLNTIEPNIADTIDDVKHHNEYAIAIRGGNFRIEYGPETPYSTKKLVDTINSILDEKYGKLVEPKITPKGKRIRIVKEGFNKNEIEEFTDINSEIIVLSKKEADEYIRNNKNKILSVYDEGVGKKPTQTNENLKESIESIKNKVPYKIQGTPDFIDVPISKEEYEKNILTRTETVNRGYWKNIPSFQEHAIVVGTQYRYFDKKGTVYFRDAINNTYKKRVEKQDKEYYSQAEINTKVAALKKGKRVFPRSLIRSEIRPIKDSFSIDTPFQRISKQDKVTQPEVDNVLQEFANNLSERFNIPVELISEEEAKKVNSNYNGEPAFYDANSNKAYLIKGKANKTSAVHEIFTHPFLLQIEKTNPKLYANLLKEAKSNIDIVDYVNNKYKSSEQRILDHEYIARAVDLYAKNELDEQKDKGLIARIKELFNELSDYLKKLFNIPEVFSNSISPNTTLEELTQYALYGKGKMDLKENTDNLLPSTIKDNLKNFLIDKGIISKSGKILNQEYIDYYNEMAKDKYDIKSNLIEKTNDNRAEIREFTLNKVKNIAEHRVKQSRNSSQDKKVGKTSMHLILLNLQTRFGIPFKYDYNQKTLGRVEDGVVYINPNLARADTLFHEFAHPFISILKRNNSELYDNLIEEVKKDKELMAFIGEEYKEYSYEDQLEEALVTAIGMQASEIGVTAKTKLGQLIQDFFKYISDLISKFTGTEISAFELASDLTIKDLADMMVNSKVDLVGLGTSVSSYMKGLNAQQRAKLRDLINKGKVKIIC